MNLADEIRYVHDMRRVADRAARVAEEARHNFELAQRQLWDRMDAEGVTSIKVDGAQHVARSTIYGTVNDKSAFVAWAEEHEPELLAPAPRKALINELVRQRIDNGEELPPGVNYYTKDYVTMPGGKDGE